MSVYDRLFDAVNLHGPRRPVRAPRCRCIGGPRVDWNDRRHGIITCFWCGKQPADSWLARHRRNLG